MNGMQGNRYLLLGLLVLVLAGGLLYTMFRSSSTQDSETATTTDMSQSSTTTSGTGGTKPTTVTTPNSLVKIEYTGGTCPNGKSCYNYKVITKDAVYFKNGVKVSTVNKTDVTKLSLEIDKANWALIRSKPHVGTCITTVREEIIYTFYTRHGEEKISDCATEIDFNLPLFKLIPTILPTNM